jgi:hypothetical protein
MQTQDDIHITCPHCRGDFKFPAEGLGMTAPCPFCQENVLLQAPQPESHSREDTKAGNKLGPPDRPKRSVPEALIVFATLAVSIFIILPGLNALKFNGLIAILSVANEGTMLYCVITLAWLFGRWVLLRTVPQLAPKWPHFLKGLRRLVIIVISFTFAGISAWLTIKSF